MLYATYTICICLWRHMYISYKFPPLKSNPDSTTVNICHFLVVQGFYGKASCFYIY